MSQLDELYREVILDHYRNPRKRGSLKGPHLHAEGNNPSCGDEFAIDVAIDGGVITDAAMQGQGCSISQASGSMMMDAIVGKSIDEARDITHKFKVMMTIEDGESPVDPDRPGSVLGDLEALQGVRKFPVRIKCADLAWTTLTEALDRATNGDQ
ncbi:MAG: SUF system NifU family Fe-S cluster assembly protein [Actinomycetia bacterium]|nr:SUF system NifU family Fe-S cluster assembly protein [Actinomycetes bacterium]